MTTGPAFRSRLEQDIADEMDALDIAWQYERPVVLPDGKSLRYLPDFLIGEHNEWQHDGPLPQWIEGKPQQFIYDLRDSLGVTRRYGDRFSGTISIPDVTSDQLRERHIDELWKPKKLAEITGQTVLVIGGVGGTSRLSCEMHPDAITFSRDNWIVNHKGLELRRERDRRHEESQRIAAEWTTRRDEQQRALDGQRAIAESQRQQARTSDLRLILAHPVTGHNRHAGRCPGCEAHVEPGDGNLRNTPLVGGGSRWFVICARCEQTPR